MTNKIDKRNFQEMSFGELEEFFVMERGSFEEMLEGRSFSELDRLLDCAVDCLYDDLDWSSKDYDIDAIRGKMVIIESRLKAVAPCVCDAVYQGPYRGERLPGCREFDDCCGDCECERGGCVRGKVVCLAALHHGRMWECHDCEGYGGCRKYM